MPSPHQTAAVVQHQDPADTALEGGEQYDAETADDVLVQDYRYVWYVCMYVCMYVVFVKATRKGLGSKDVSMSLQ